MKLTKLLTLTALCATAAMTPLLAADPTPAAADAKPGHMMDMQGMMKDKDMMRKMCAEMAKDPAMMKMMCDEMMKNPEDEDDVPGNGEKPRRPQDVYGNDEDARQEVGRDGASKRYCLRAPHFTVNPQDWPASLVSSKSTSAVGNRSDSASICASVVAGGGGRRRRNASHDRAAAAYQETDRATLRSLPPK